MRSRLYFTGETNHRWKYTSEISGTEDDEAYEGATVEKAGRMMLSAERSEGEAMLEPMEKRLPACDGE